MTLAKKLMCGVACTTMWLAILGQPSAAPAVAPTAEELGIVRRWADAFLGAAVPDGLPFSFVYNGKRFSEVSAGWKIRRDSRPIDERRSEHTVRFSDPKTGLEVACVAVVYRDFPTVEWTLYFKNLGTAETPILRDIQALDTARWPEAGGEFVLHHAAGSQANRSDYGPRETPLGPGATKRFSAAGGRPTNTDMSYFNLQWRGGGAIVVVGWPGQWAAEFARDAKDGIRVTAGQERTHFKLLPGEEVRTPLVVLQFWKGDYVRSQNLWRRWMMAYGMPKPGGKLPPPQFVASSSRAYEEMIKANEANQIMHIDRYLEEGFKLDYWWMDAGWYIQERGWPQVGTWEVDPKRFPRGFKPISDHAHSKGVKILVWFEPERVAPGTWLYENRPEWLLRDSGGTQNPLAGMRSWRASDLDGPDPCVSCNLTQEPRSSANIHWEPGRLSFHPGPKGEYAAIRWTAPEAGEYSIQAKFLALDQTTTDVHVRAGGRAVCDGLVGLPGKDVKDNTDHYDGKVTVEKGGTVDFVVGWGNGTHVCDSTGLDARVTRIADGKTFDAAKEFSAEQNPGGPWSYGHLKPGATPDGRTFRPFDRPGKMGDEGTRLLNLGNPAARQWLTDHVDKLLTEQGIDLYRQDFNMDPLAFWRNNDAPDRQGITEIKHVTGYLAYWDELRRRHPNMLIDSCASGGRRNDLETMRRSVPLWRSDYAFEAIGHQCMTYGISFWLPYHGTGTVATDKASYYGSGLTPVDPYAFWSNAAPSLGSGVDFRIKELDYATLRKLYQQFREISPLYYGDFYPLTPYSQDNSAWIAWQFHSPESGEGFVQAFRRGESPDESAVLKLQCLEPEGRYILRSLEAKPSAVGIASFSLSSGSDQASGRELMDGGLRIALGTRPGAAVISYKAGPKK